MIFKSRYHGRSAVVNGMDSARVALAANTLRETTFFEGRLAQPLLLREALAALYDVVVSDYKYRPRDRLEFQAWLEEQDRRFLASLQLKGASGRKRMEELEGRLAELDAARHARRKPFYRARRAYFDYIYQNDYELELLLDPVITVHPDEISFEAFSRDESTYARLAARFDLFENVKAFECGTTNIDFSVQLHGQMERMRTYRQTRFTIDPQGFGASISRGKTVREKKIDLPDSWLRGFLQVHATMAMSLTHVQLAPVDLFNICRRLRRQKARRSPRSLRWELAPGRPGRVVLEPWELPIEFTSTWGFPGAKEFSTRTWGRDRLAVLSRLLPHCQRVDVFLAGYGLPSFYVLDLGPISGGCTFTLGLSGWTDNDWTGEADFELLTRRLDISAAELLSVYEALRKHRYAAESGLAAETGLGVEKCRSAMSYLCQAGRAMVDMGSDVYRHRDLLFTPFTQKEAMTAVRATTEETSPAAKSARRIFEQGDARLTARQKVSTGVKLRGSVKGSDGQRYRPTLHIDREGRIIEASCTCPHFKKFKLTKGPCECVLALRQSHMHRVDEEDQS